jgi:alpha-beta hydrolase superfamily lysophospholipase
VVVWYVLAAVVAVPVLWLCGDLVYGLVMRLQYARWERSIERDAQGVRAGCREGALGAGDVAVLLVHGFGDSPAVWLRIAPALAERGFAVRTVRLPCHGLTMAQYCKTDSAQWRQAVQDALAELRQSHARVVLVAHSLGGAVALDALAEHPELADGLVLLAPLIDVSARRSPLLHPRTWYRILDRLLLFTDRIGMVYPPDLHDPEARPLMRDDRFVPRVVYREMFALLARNRGRAAAFRTPLLLVLAAGDLVIDNRAAEQFFADYGGAPKRREIMAEAGHMLPLDFGWDKIVDEIARFARAPAGAAEPGPGA